MTFGSRSYDRCDRERKYNLNGQCFVVYHDPLGRSGLSRNGKAIRWLRNASAEAVNHLDGVENSVEMFGHLRWLVECSCTRDGAILAVESANPSVRCGNLDRTYPLAQGLCGSDCEEFGKLSLSKRS